MTEENNIEELKAKCDEYLNGWKRERADFLNYKKEESARISELCSYSNKNLIIKILPILDNIEMAETHLKDEGLAQIKKQFIDILNKEGVEEIKVIGEKFNPEYMEAVEGDGDTVSEEVQRGYMLNGKVIRPAKVKISK